MKLPRKTENAWPRLAQLAAQAPAELEAGVPFGFATRVVAAWKADRRENALAAFEWLTMRGFAIALIIFAGSAALSYDAVADAFTGDGSLVGGWVDFLPMPL